MIRSNHHQTLAIKNRQSGETQENYFKANPGNWQIHVNTCRVVNTPTDSYPIENTKLNENNNPLRESNEVGAPSLKISPLTYVDIVVDGKQMRALNDSGAMVPLIRKSSLQEIRPIGQVQIQGVVGQPAVTPLVALDVKFARDQLSDFAPLEQTLNIVFAIVDELPTPCEVILPADVVTKLQSLTAMGLLSEPPPKSKTCLDDLFKSGGGTADDVVK